MGITIDRRLSGVAAMQFFTILVCTAMLAGCDINFSAKDGVPIGTATDMAPDQYRTEFENDWVKVIRAGYAAGESSAMHSHKRTVGVHLTAVSRLFTSIDGVAERRDTAALVPFEIPGNDVHAAENRLDHPTESVYVELKASYQPTLAEAPNGFDRYPELHQLLLEGEGYRVFKTTYAEGMQAPLHSYNAKVSVFITDARFLVETLEGVATERMVAAGEVRWGDETSHKVTNLGELFEVLVIELM